MKHQTDVQLQKYINKYGCFFMGMVYWFTFKLSEIDLSYAQLNSIWNEAIKLNIISGDENNDGDMDDYNELLILDKDQLLQLAKLKLRYIGSFLPDAVIKRPGQLYIGEFYNDRTKFTHFVGIDERFVTEYDPIKNSVTVREGILKTVRVFA